MRLYIQMNDDIHSIEEKSQIFEIYPSNIRAVVNVEWDEDRMKGEADQISKEKMFWTKKIISLSLPILCLLKPTTSEIIHPVT